MIKSSFQSLLFQTNYSKTWSKQINGNTFVQHSPELSYNLAAMPWLELWLQQLTNSNSNCRHQVRRYDKVAIKSKLPHCHIHQWSTWIHNTMHGIARPISWALKCQLQSKRETKPASQRWFCCTMLIYSDVICSQRFPSMTCIFVWVWGQFTSHTVKQQGCIVTFMIRQSPVGHK
jgi:hypothetical protein